MRLKIILLCAIFALFSASVGAQTATYTLAEFGDATNTVALTIDWVADGTGAVSWDTDVTPTNARESITEYLKGMMCVRAITIPDGVTPPTANYDIVVNENSGDVFGGTLANRSATATEFSCPDVLADATLAAFGGAIFYDTWTVSVTNAGSGGTGQLILIFAR